jgi:hypothetical protein
MDVEDERSAAPRAEQHEEHAAHEPSGSAVDVQQLAERVYRLMQDELRLEIKRGINANSFRRNSKI